MASVMLHLVSGAGSLTVTSWFFLEDTNKANPTIVPGAVHMTESGLRQAA